MTTQHFCRRNWLTDRSDNQDPGNEDAWLTPEQAAQLLAHLSGQPLRRQRLQQLCSEGVLLYRDVDVVHRERRISRASIERLAQQGLPPRGMRAAVQRHGHGLDMQQFSGQDLQGICLRNAPLSGMDFSGADLRGADLRAARLEGACLRNADLRGADLRGALLDNADLRASRMEGALLDGACLTGADLSRG